jgi:hypothetical protein
MVCSKLVWWRVDVPRSQVLTSVMHIVLSSVINDPALRLILLIQLVFGLHSRLLDIGVAFLHGYLDEEI